MPKQITHSWVTSPQVGFRHPWWRILTSMIIIVCDFFIYAEDPIADSETECNLPFVGDVITMVIAKYPSEGGFACLKIMMVLICMFLGCYLGRQWVHHKLLQKTCGVRMFRNNHGTFLIMGMTTAICLYIGAQLYNAFLPDDITPISGALGITNRQFGKVAQCCTWLGDLSTVVMVWDAMFQDETHYPHWPGKKKDEGTSSFKALWRTGWNDYFRVVVTWVTCIGLSAMVFIGISMSGNGSELSWSEHGWGYTSEVSRTLVISMIVFTDLMIVIQDWSFPTFDESLQADVLIAGTFVTEINIDCISRCVERLKQSSCVQAIFRYLDDDFFTINISGKWMNYGPLLIIIMLDCNMIKNQLIYHPVDYGQYVDPSDNSVWTIVDQAYLDLAYVDGLVVYPELISWDVRMGAVNTTASILTDVHSSTRWIDEPKSTLYVIALVAVSAIVGFVVMVIKGTRVYARFVDEEETGVPEEEGGKVEKGEKGQTKA